MTDPVSVADEFGRNLFLDFLNRDSRQYLGIFGRVGLSEETMLRQAINVALILTRDACYFPPGFLVEDKLVRRIIEQYEAVREARLFRLPVRESLDELWAKKEREYDIVRGDYSGLFERDGRRFVEQNARLLIDRSFPIGANIVTDWEAAPDVADSWASEYISKFQPGVIEVFRRVPSRLADAGKAITWSTISRQIPEVAQRNPRYRSVMQHVYFSIYVSRLGLRVLKNVPLMRSTFGLETEELFYDYSALEQVATAAGVWEELLEMPPEAIVGIRREPEYFHFRSSYLDLCLACDNDSYLLREALAERRDERARLLRAVPLPQPALVRDPYLEAAVCTRLCLVVESSLERRREAVERRETRRRLFPGSYRSVDPVSEWNLKERANVSRIGIYAPLSEERQILVRALGLKPTAGSQYRWAGQLGEDAEVLLYSSQLMGRVPATASTCRVLNETQDLDALVVVGFAGGFTESGVKQGHVLIPSIVADLAARKIGSPSGYDAKIRPQPYRLDGRLEAWLDTHFDKTSWLARAATDAEWPEGQHPVLKMGGTIVCGDEVVASNEHRATLLESWPQALGVEMECGGVAAACEIMGKTHIPLFQIRVVTDMADPLKSDDQWRTIGAKTLASLIGTIKWREVLGL